MILIKLSAATITTTTFDFCLPGLFSGVTAG